jgi:hypothetical protein
MGGLVGGVSNVLFGKNKNKNPANEAMPYLNNISPVTHSQLNPYIQRGNEAYGQASKQYNSMTQNPMAFVDEIMRGYKPSEGFNFRKEQAQNELANAARAGGYRGTKADQFANADLADKLLSGGQNDYLQQVLQVLGGGLQGQENSINRGYSSSTDMANILANVLGSQAGLAFKGQENQNASNNAERAMNGELFGQVLGAVTGVPMGGGGSNPFGGGGGGNPFGGAKPNNGYSGNGYSIGSGFGTGTTSSAPVSGYGPNYSQFGGAPYKGKIL